MVMMVLRKISESPSISFFSSIRGSSSLGGITNTKCFRISVATKDCRFGGYEMMENKTGAGMGGPEEPRPRMFRI